MSGFGTLITGPSRRPMRGRFSYPPHNEPAPGTAAYIEHIKKLRARNLTRSPLLRLPYEIVVRILLFVTYNGKPTPACTTVLPTCYYLCQLILSTPELWGGIYCSPAEAIFRRFEMAAWSPTEIHVPYGHPEEVVGAALDGVRDASQLRRDRIHTLDFRGTASLWPHFSWIFDEPLPNIKHLSISAENTGIAIPLMDSIGKPLETLSIHNVGIPPSLRHFCSLKNLRIGHSSACDFTMYQLITLLDSSLCLETFSLEHARSNDLLHDYSQPKRVATLPHLNSLKLSAPTSEIVYILDHLSLPAIDSLTLDSSDLGCSRFTSSGTKVIMGGFLLDRHALGNWTKLLSATYRMVPLSVTELEIARDTVDERNWREFAERRPGVRSIVSSYEPRNCGLSKGLWCALSPDHRRHPTVLFPKLESITLKAEHLSMIPTAALCCLRMRSDAGFKLKRLEVQGTGKLRNVGRKAEDFRPLADEFVYSEAPIVVQPWEVPR